MDTPKSARAAPARAGSDPRIEQLAGRLDREDSQIHRLIQGIGADFRHISIGIDIGIGGGVSRLGESGALLGVDDIPVLADGPAGRRAINAPLLAELIANSHATRAFVEYVGARPGEGAVGAFAFGRSRGVVEGVLGALGVPITFLTPPVWKRAVGLPPGKDGAKDAARAEAIRRWPAQAALFARKKDDGRAEAALIPVAGLMREGRHG